MKQFLYAYLFQMKETVQKKGFIIVTLLMVAVIFAIGFFNYQSSQKEVEKETITLLDQSKAYDIQKDIFLESFGEEFEFQLTKKTKEALTEEVEKGDIDGFYVLSEAQGLPTLQYIYKKQTDTRISMWLEQHLKEQYIVQVATEKNLTTTDIQELFAPVVTEYIEQVDMGKSYGLVYPMIYAMLIFIMGFGQSIAVNVVSEKSSKVMEVLLPKIHPIYSLYAKILAALSTGLLQFVILVTSFWVTIQIGWASSDSLNIVGLKINLEDIHLSTLCWFVFFFISGFLFYGLVYAALGAMVSKVEELNSLLTPVIFLLMGSFGIGMYSILEPNALLSVISPYIPPFTPLVLFARILLGEASLFEIIGSLTIFFLAFVVITYFCQKWYKQGVTGGKVLTFKKKKN